MLNTRQKQIEDILNEANVYEDIVNKVHRCGDFEDNYNWKGFIEDIDYDLDSENMKINKENVLMLFNEYIYE